MDASMNIMNLPKPFKVSTYQVCNANHTYVTPRRSLSQTRLEYAVRTTVIYVFKIALAVGPVTHAAHFHSGLMSRRSKALLAGVSSPVPS